MSFVYIKTQEERVSVYWLDLFTLKHKKKTFQCIGCIALIKWILRQYTVVEKEQMSWDCVATLYGISGASQMQCALMDNFFFYKIIPTPSLILLPSSSAFVMMLGEDGLHLSYFARYFSEPFSPVNINI